MNRVTGLLLVALRRAAAGLLLLVGASFIIYVTIRSAPGDAVDAITPMGTPDDLKQKLAAEFGLDRDPLSGYVTWLGRSATGDFGESLVVAAGEPVMAVAGPAFVKTLALAGVSLLAAGLLALLGAMLLGDPSARQQWLTGPLYFGTAAPSYVVAVLFTQGMNWFVHAFVEQGGYETPVWYPIPIASDSAMPYVFAGLVLLAGDGLYMDYLNTVRAELNALRNAQFIAAVRAKGAGVVRHIARNLVVPFVSAFASRLPIVLGGAVIVEYVFTLEGAGYLLLEAARERDFPVVVGLSVLFTVTIIAVGLLADVVRAIVDPREVARGG